MGDLADRARESFEQLDGRITALRVDLFDAFIRAVGLSRFVEWMRRRQPPLDDDARP